jgi:hypothetical protein
MIADDTVLLSVFEPGALVYLRFIVHATSTGNMVRTGIQIIASVVTKIVELRPMKQCYYIIDTTHY